MGLWLVSVMPLFFSWVGATEERGIQARLNSGPEELGGTAVSLEESIITIGPSIPIPVSGLVRQVRASASPDSPDALLVCSYQSDGKHARNLSAAYVSLDGGNSWLQTLLDVNSRHVSEVSCASGPNGNAYFVAGVSDTNNALGRHEAGTAEIYRSWDSGLTWTIVARYPFIDWTALAADSSSGSSQSKVYLFGNLIAAGIGDRGEGKWEEKRGPLLVSNDGLHFSGPRFLPDQWIHGNPGALPLSALTLANGSALALYDRSADSTDKEYRFRLYRADGKSYEPVSNIDMPTGLKPYTASAQMAIDRNGHFAGRLYVAFSALKDDRNVLGLATSSDAGRSWRTRVILEGDAVKPGGPSVSPYAAVAVNKDGIVGIEWQPRTPCPIFVVSMDGGATANKPQPLGRCITGSAVVDTSREVAGRMLALSARGAVDHLGVTDREASDALPGFMFRVDPTAVGDVQIAADAGGRFHAFWTELAADGTTELLTTTIGVGRSQPPMIAMRRILDVTPRSVVSVIKEQFDPEQETFGVDAVVENGSSEAMDYPSTLQVASAYSDCGEVKFVNQVGTSLDGLALFRVPARPDRRHLLPRESTLPVHLEIRVEGCKPDLLLRQSLGPKANGEWFYPLSVRFRVFADTDESRGADRKESVCREPR